MVKVEKILVPVDFSDCAKSALEHAAFWGRSFGATVHVLHVWQPPYYLSADAMVSIARSREQTLAEFARSHAGKEMERFLTEVEKDGEISVLARIESGDPTHTILEVATDGYDLVVMGTHGRTGLSHVLLGSVAERVVRRAPCPVLTIQPPKGRPQVSQTG